MNRCPYVGTLKAHHASALMLRREIMIKSLSAYVVGWASVLGLFNLIPLPPLDGSRILFAFLPARYYFSIMRYERMIALLLMLFLLTGANFGFLDTIAGGISRAMESLWNLLPVFS